MMKTLKIELPMISYNWGDKEETVELPVVITPIVVDGENRFKIQPVDDKITTIKGEKYYLGREKIIELAQEYLKGMAYAPESEF